MTKSMTWFLVLALFSFLTLSGALAPSAMAERVQVINYVADAEQAEGLVSAPETGEHVLVSLEGPGVFVAARMVKQGGVSGLTAVTLEIDGKTVVQRNIAALRNWGMTQMNPFGVVLLSSGDIDTVTIGYPVSIAYRHSLTLKAMVGESGVVQIIGTVVHGR